MDWDRRTEISSECNDNLARFLAAANTFFVRAVYFLLWMARANGRSNWSKVTWSVAFKNACVAIKWAPSLVLMRLSIDFRDPDIAVDLETLFPELLLAPVPEVRQVASSRSR